MADMFYNNAYKHIMTSTDLAANTIKVALVTSSYTPDAANHEYFSDITNEVTGTGYTAGGATLTNKTVTTVGTKGVFNADDPTWTSSTISNARRAIYYKDTGTASTSPLLHCYDFGTDKSSSASTFTVEHSADGIFDMTKV